MTPEQELAAALEDEGALRARVADFLGDLARLAVTLPEGARVEDHVDAWVESHDPGDVRRARVDLAAVIALAEIRRDTENFCNQAKGENP
jgi:hypothetical protein